jgi:hypothetical protein
MTMSRLLRGGRDAAYAASLLLGVAGLVVSTPSARGEEPPPPGLVAAADTLVLDPGQLVVCLGHRFVLASTLELREGDRALRAGIDYAIDADQGCLTLLAGDTLGVPPAEAPDSLGAPSPAIPPVLGPPVPRILVAVYRAAGFPLESAYRLREDPHLTRAPEPAPAADGGGKPQAFTGEAESAGLDVSGSKTFGIEVGNRRDLKLRQSLDLRLSGKVTHDVSLLAVLSDQDVPFQPEGNTAELSELDKVLIEIKSPRAGASLGDVGFGVSGLEFLQLERELQGFTGQATLGDGTVRGAVASAKGEFTTRQFFGQDGKQGPYRLTDRTGNSDIVVVAGSEKVWIDGQALKRGEENDYVIDYSLGEITFTSKRVITANTEVTVDYQFATGRYRRRVTFGAADRKLGNLGLLRAAYYQEGDDASTPFGGELSAAEKAELAALGDSARVAGGTRYVGPGLGDYDLVADPASGKDIYVFVDGTGDYEVVFVNVGEGKGEYAIDEERSAATTVYVFVGEGNGSFVPRRDLPAPERRRIGDLRWELSGPAGGVSVEGAFADADGNVLSPLDDGNNRGGAVTAQGKFNPVSLGGAWRVAPGFHYRRVGENFQSPARLRDGFFTRQWNLTGTEDVRGEDLAELAAELSWGDKLRWTAEGGRLALADTFTSVRQKQGVSWSDRWVRATGTWNTARDEVSGATGDLTSTAAAVTLRRWPVQPSFRVLHETRRRALGGGERHRDWEGSLAFPVGPLPLKAEIGSGHRLDDSLGTATGEWRGALDTRRAFGSVEGTWRDLTVLMRYEARQVRGEGTGRERRDTGRIDLRHQALRGAWSALLTADVGSVGLRQRAKLIVADSTGYFDQFGNYVGPGGGYDVQLGPPGEETLTGQVNVSTRMRWSAPGNDRNLARWLRAFAWEGYATVNEASALPLVQPRYFLSPNSYLSRSSTLDGRLNARQTVDLFPSHRELGFRVRQETTRRMVRTPQGTGGDLVQIQNQDDLAGTLRSNPAPGWDAEVEGSLGTRREEVDLGLGGRFLQETDLHSGTLRGGRQFAAIRGRGRVSAEITYSTEIGADREAKGTVIRPRLQWSRPKVGRLDVRYSRTTLSAKSGFTAIQGVGAPTLREGWRLDVITETQLSRGITVTGTAAVDDPKDLARVIEGRVEVRGTF